MLHLGWRAISWEPPRVQGKRGMQPTESIKEDESPSSGATTRCPISSHLSVLPPAREPGGAGRATRCLSEPVLSSWSIWSTRGHLLICKDLGMFNFFLAFIWGVLLRVRNAALCPHEYYSLRVWEELENSLRGTVPWASAGAASPACGSTRSAAPGKRRLRLCRFSLHLVPLMPGQLVRILIKFLGDGFFCSLYFLKWTSVSLFTSIALVLSSCFLSFQTINFIFFLRIQSTQGY